VFFLGRSISRTFLSAGAALAATAGLSGFAQSAPGAGAGGAGAPGAGEEVAAALGGPLVEPGGTLAEEVDQDTVFVLGRRVSSSIATLPSVEDAAQVINVISGALLAEQGVTTLEQALRNVPGITTQIGEGGVMNGDQFFIRGLSAKDDIYTDGLRDFGVFTRDSFNFSQIEVLKGPSSTTLGRGTTGGGINTSSKAPYLETGGALSLAAGSADYLRATGDWNQALSDDIAVRLNVMVHQNEVEGRDAIQSERWGIAPSIGFGLSARTSFTLSALHQEDDRVPDYGIPTVLLAGRGLPADRFGVPTSNFYGYGSDTDETTVDTVTARLRHLASDTLTFTSDTKVGVYTRYFQQTAPGQCAAACVTALTDSDPLTVPMVAIGGPGPYDQTTTGVQNVSTLTLTAPISGFRNELLAGWDVSWQNNDRDQFNYATTGPTARIPKNFLAPARSPDPTLQAVRNNVRDSTARDVSLFVSNRFWFSDRWSVSGGVRAQWFEMDQNTTAFTVNPATGAVTSVYTPLSSNSDFVTPRASVMWEPTPAQSYYLSYATSATPPGTTVANGSATTGATSELDPEENESLEAGAKFSLFEDRLLVQTAIFQVNKNNAKDIDPSSGLITAQSGDSQEVTGFEVGAGGRLTNEWAINASYALTESEITESTTPANIGNRVQFSPRQAASLWTTYDFSGALLGLQVGGGVTYQDEVPLNPANTAFAPDYVTFDALVSYAVDRYRLSLNAYNLADELFYSQVHGNRLVPAAGRTVTATLGVAF